MNKGWIEAKLEAAQTAGLARAAFVHPPAGGMLEVNGKRILNFSGNDYLNLVQHPVVIERARRALEAYGSGATASRLVSGTLPLHETLEARLASQKGYAAALLFGSGYMANIGTIPVLVERNDLIFADKLIHACMVDGAKLSGAKLIRFAHNDPAALAARLEQFPAGCRRRLILTESVFSMDGSLAPLKEIAALAQQHNAMLMVDEAHATGVFGPCGAGRVRAMGLEKQVTVSMGTMSKGMAGYGGLVACQETLRQLLVQSSRAFIYTTAPPPAVAGAALGALDVLESEPELGATLQRRAAAFRARLRTAGLDTLSSESQVVPVMIGGNEPTLTIAGRLREVGILVGAIRPPTVPVGTARLRISITLAHSETDLEYAAGMIIRAAQGKF